jgi:hypothetical protein
VLPSSCASLQVRRHLVKMDQPSTSSGLGGARRGETRSGRSFRDLHSAYYNNVADLRSAHRIIFRAEPSLTYTGEMREKEADGKL